MICVCGSTFERPPKPHGKAKLYCSVRCRTRYRMRAWRANNPEKAAALDARQDEQRRVRNAIYPELSKAREAARYAADSNLQRARVSAYRSIRVNRLRCNVASATWRAANPEKQRAARLRWEAANPERVAHYLAKWRARRRGNGGSHTLAEWRVKCASFGHLCAYCCEPKPLTRDHDIPLSRGGTDDIMNIIPACRLCNSKKRTRTAAEFVLLMPTNDATTGLIRIV